LIGILTALTWGCNRREEDVKPLEGVIVNLKQSKFNNRCVATVRFCVGTNSHKTEIYEDLRFIVPSTKEFYEWFNDDFHGKIIHWTKLKY